MHLVGYYLLLEFAWSVAAGTGPDQIRVDNAQAGLLWSADANVQHGTARMQRCAIAIPDNPPTNPRPLLNGRYRR